MAWDLIASKHGWLVYRQEHAEVLRLQGQLDEMQQKRERLAADILRLRKNPEALEELVHRELGYVYPDEYMVIVPQQNPAAEDKGTTK